MAADESFITWCGRDLHKLHQVIPLRHVMKNTFGENVRNLIFRVHMTTGNVGVQFNSLEQSIQINTMRSRKHDAYSGF